MVLIVAVILGFSVISYTILVFSPFLKGPLLVITEPRSTAALGVVKIAGTTERVAFLTINGEEVPLSEGGDFSAYRAFPPGYTALEIRVRDRFGREEVRTLALITNKQNTNENHGAEEKEY